ncbi:UNKNOWN [Stylonychia lemnae]|uniref:Uncharacterized protein n=1 Tax=Stylonychia lemnae TaxID=5949 RepID=A0A078AC00_STYLE|nr:UNKNOWN [Stylonychia lemnae]|eukprot:CDW79820.1 UNKNOWN [Stylonychia lemnae]
MCLKLSLRREHHLGRIPYFHFTFSRIGKEKRVEPGTENKILLGVPGPTAYNIPSRVIEGPKISLSPRIESNVTDIVRLIPGPGAYTPALQKRADFSFSFGLKPVTDLHVKYVKSIPGPGAYHQNFKSNFSKIGASLDKSVADLSNKTVRLVPGPGAYEPSNISLISRNSAPKYGFGTSDRRATTSHESTKSKRDGQINSSSILPGPGQYELRSIVGNEGPKNSLSYRYKVDQKAKEDLLKPGPGQYAPELNQVIKQSPNYKIGTSKRESYYLKERDRTLLPPPNVYRPQFEKIKRNAPSTGFGYGDRGYLNKTFTDTIPGPGNYQTPTKLGEGPKYFIGQKLESKRALILPSPDNYNPRFDTIQKRTGNYTVGRAQRISPEKKNNVPGPGQYLNQDSLTSFNVSPKYGFGSSSQRPHFKEQAPVPGPGAYKLKSTIADVPAYLIPNQNESYKTREVSAFFAKKGVIAGLFTMAGILLAIFFKDTYQSYKMNIEPPVGSNKGDTQFLEWQKNQHKNERDLYLGLSTLLAQMQQTKIQNDFRFLSGMSYWIDKYHRYQEFKEKNKDD